MKKIAPLLLVFLLFAGCQTKNYTPEIPVAFKNNATVTSGDFSYKCEICKTQTNVAVTVLSTNAKGLEMVFDGDNLTYEYDNYSCDIDASNFEKSNLSIVIYEVFDYISKSEVLNVRRIDSGFRYEGKVSLGDFILIQNDDNSFKSLSFRGMDYTVEFE